jgi:hypothetical protein
MTHKKVALMKLVADTSMLVIGLTLVVGGVLGIVRYEPGEPYSSPDPRTTDTATIYVGESKGEGYRVRWDDFSGTTLEKGRKRGVLGDDPVVYEEDLGHAPTDARDLAEILRASKLKVLDRTRGS